MNKRIDEATGRVILVAIATWAAVVAGAAIENTFGKFDARTLATFAAGVALYGFAVYRLDPQVHAFIQGFSRVALVAAACLAMATLAIASFEHVPALAVFIAPLAAVASGAAVEKLATRPTKARGKSPAATPAAT